MPDELAGGEFTVKLRGSHQRHYLDLGVSASFLPSDH